MSPVGVGDGYSANNGCDFGPDTAGTTTCGIQEAINALPASIGRNYTGSTSTAAVSGTVLLGRGVFEVTRPIEVPAYSAVTLQGVG